MPGENQKRDGGTGGGTDKRQKKGREARLPKTAKTPKDCQNTQNTQNTQNIQKQKQVSQKKHDRRSTKKIHGRRLPRASKPSGWGSGSRTTAGLPSVAADEPSPLGQETTHTPGKRSLPSVGYTATTAPSRPPRIAIVGRAGALPAAGRSEDHAAHGTSGGASALAEPSKAKTRDSRRTPRIIAAHTRSPPAPSASSGHPARAGA
jgi:hypothetical protein